MAAESMGLSTCWVGAFEDLAINNIFKFRPGLRVVSILTMGYSNETVPTPSKQPISNYVFFNSFGGDGKIEDLDRLFRDFSLVTTKTAEKTKDFFDDIGNKFKSIFKK